MSPYECTRVIAAHEAERSSIWFVYSMMVLDDIDDGSSSCPERLNFFKIDPEMAEEAPQLFKRQQTSDIPLPMPDNEC